MAVFIKLVIWLHIMGFALGTAGGLAMAQVGPRLVRSPPDGRDTWWPLAKGLSTLSSIGILLLLVTGPLVLWLRYGGVQGLNVWFTVKMALVVAVVIAHGLAKVGMGRLKRGNEGGAKLMAVAGPLTGLAVFGAALAAVFAFR